MRLRRLFFAAAIALAAACPTPQPQEGPPASSTASASPGPRAGVGWQVSSRDHRKLLVVDGVIAFTGSANISRIEPQPAAADPKIGRRELYVALLLAITDARQRVWLTYGYFVADERMLNALEQAARRGVDVRLVMPGREDAWVPFHAGRARYGELLGAGVRVFERRDTPLATRTATAEGIWTSFEPGGEQQGTYPSDLMVFDRGLARQLEQLFQLDQAVSHEVSLAEWRRRGLASRFKEWLARCCERLF